MASSLDTSLSRSYSLSDVSLLKLRYLNRAKLFSLSLSQLSFSKLLSLVAQAFPETQNGSSATAAGLHRYDCPFTPHIHTATHIEISYRDEDGDSVVIDSDESLNLAALSFQIAHVEVIILQINVKDDQNINNDYDIPKKSLTPTSACIASSSKLHPHIPCQDFQAGSCRFGLSCRVLHQSTCDKMKSSKSGSLLDEFEINKWLITQRSASEDENISYLSSQEGYDSFMQILNHPHLPLIAIYQLASLLTRPMFRTSFRKQATDKIYNCFIGSQFLVALRLHIRTSVKPILGCIEPYVFLCQEIVERTSNGWKEVPVDELKNLVEKVENGSAWELSYIIAQLLDHRDNKESWMETVDEESGSFSLGSNFRDLPFIPSKEQLFSREKRSRLPVKQAGARDPHVAEHLDTHFRMMQEDCIATLRDDIQELRKTLEVVTHMSTQTSSFHASQMVMEPRFSSFFQCQCKGGPLATCEASDVWFTFVDVMQQVSGILMRSCRKQDT